MFKGIVNGLNIKKQAEDLEVSIWQTPSFLFLVMGAIIMTAMALVYFISRHYNSPEILIVSEVSVVISIFILGGSLIKSIEAFTKADKMKSEFISIASHQLKTPLSEIKWEVELFLSKRRETGDQELLDFVGEVAKSNSKMIKLVNNLLNITRLSQKKFALKKDRFNVLEIIEKAVRENKILAKTKNVEIKFADSAKSIPEVVGDSRGIKAVVDNLLSNAVKFTEKGEIKISVDSQDEKVTVRVKDSGAGISKSEQGKVFQKFFRGSNDFGLKTEGTGLGLYLAKSIVEQCNGKMWFKSKEGKGSTFCFSLPSCISSPPL